MELHLKRAHGLNLRIETEPKGDKPNVKKEDPPKNESSESDSDSDSDYEDVPDLYKYKKWESGSNFKSRTPAFYKASINFRTIFKKGANYNHADNLQIKVLEVTKNGGGKLAKIKITDEEGTGEVQMQTFGPKKRTKEVTVQIAKSSNGELHHVELLATKIIKPLLDKLLEGGSVKNLVNTFF